MPKFKGGDKVRQTIKPIEGEIAGVQVDKVTYETLYLVVWEDEDGEQSSRYFKEDEIGLA